MGEKALLFGFSVFLGVIIAVHLAMNARVGELLGSPRAGNSLFWLIGAVTGLIIWAAGGEWVALQRAQTVPGGLWLAGVFGASLVLGVSYTMPRLGAGPTTIGLLAGQLIAGIVISHFGWLSPQAIPVSATKLVGVGAVAVGIYLVVF